MKKFMFLLSLLPLGWAAMAQNDRLTDHNSIGWYQAFLTKQLGRRTSITGEAQWRRSEFISGSQQLLLRATTLYKLNDGVSIGGGYAYVLSYIYGDYPVIVNEPTPEHRIFEQVNLTQTSGKFSFMHRFRIEQRWLARMKPLPEEGVDSYRYANRFRYFFKLQRSLGEKWFAYAGDEVFLAAGKNVGQNLFDQNRLMGILGVRLSQAVSLEAGYIKQTISQPNRINNHLIIQDNNGFIVAAMLKF